MCISSLIIILANQKIAFNSLFRQFYFGKVLTLEHFIIVSKNFLRLSHTRLIEQLSWKVSCIDEIKKKYLEFFIFDMTVVNSFVIPRIYQQKMTLKFFLWKWLLADHDWLKVIGQVLSP